MKTCLFSPPLLAMHFPLIAQADRGAGSDENWGRQ